MDVYWSIERCGWVPCDGRHDLIGTAWSVRDEDPEPVPAPDLPLQREAAPAPAEA
jgi:hypothetical protein